MQAETLGGKGGHFAYRLLKGQQRLVAHPLEVLDDGSTSDDDKLGERARPGQALG